jgi:general secretion pathway protein J
MPRRPAPNPHRTADRRRSAGFTLIEVMVALFVLALMSGMAWQGVDMVMRSREVNQQRMERLLRVQSVLTQWEVDLRQLVDTQVVPALTFDGANLRLTRLQGGEVQLVTWTLRGNTLLRWAAAPTHAVDALQEAYMTSHQLLGNEPGALAALDGVASLQLYYFDASSNAWRNAQSSGDVEDADAAAPAPAPVVPRAPAATPKSGAGREALPDGVRLVIGLTGQDGGSSAGQITREMRLVHP